MRKVSFLVAPEFELLDLSGPLCAFTLARGLSAAPYDIEVASLSGGQVASGAGVTVGTEAFSGDTGGDTAIIVGGHTAHQPDRQPDFVTMLTALPSTTRRIASVCTGAFYLAEAGILDGRRATTHWRYAPLLRSRFPGISVEADRIFVHDGDVWTSAGISAGIDLALAMIEDDLGPEVARSVAREMVVYHRRLGGQSQHSVLLELEPGSDRIRTALAFARAHLHEDLPVERLADAASISPRQFARLFGKETGETPARAIERMRAEAARPRVEDGHEPIEMIARDAGFVDAERMRRTFVKLYGQAPQAMRRSARSFFTRGAVGGRAGEDRRVD